VKLGDLRKLAKEISYIAFAEGNAQFIIENVCDDIRWAILGDK